jgi:hypothetical protein
MDQDIGPTGPEAAECGPEEPVQRVQRWPRPCAFEYGELLPKGENFQGRIPSTTEENADHGEDSEDEFRHGFTLVTWRNARWARPQQRNADC